MIVASFGGGVNSTAMLIGMVERKEPVDLILFADTGGEKPHTYAHVEYFSKWLYCQAYPEIVTVTGAQPQQISDGSLEAECLRNKALPSIAYGFKSCSMKWKLQPQKTYLKTHYTDAEITMLVGYDADESLRAGHGVVETQFSKRYPLIEWSWGRAECIEAIDRWHIPQPGKSACFFCPSSKKHEIMELRRQYPDLAARAVAMEQNAELTTIKGLGRRFAWGDLYAADDAQAKIFPETPIEQDCMCYDGEPP